MLGVVGLATEVKAWKRLRGPRWHLDNHIHGTGAWIYLPVRQPGGSSRRGKHESWATARLLHRRRDRRVATIRRSS